MAHESHQPDEHWAMGSTGIYLEMEWGLDMDWYDHNACWHPYIPLKMEGVRGEPLSTSGSDWFFDFDLTILYDHLSTGIFTIPEPTHNQIHTDITAWAWCINNICSNQLFPPRTAWPSRFDLGTLIQGFSTLEDLQAVGGVCRCTAVNYLGFLLWWTLSVSHWDANLDCHVVAIVKSLHLHRFHKRGVLVDLECDWHEINMPNLIWHWVPVAYLWMPTLASLPHFTGLSPWVLAAYDQICQSLSWEVCLSDIHDLDLDFAVIKDFDHYFQGIYSGGCPDLDVKFNDDWFYYVVDFQGWSCRQIPLCVAQHYYLLFMSSVSVEEGVNVVLFRHWEQLNNFSTDQPPQWKPWRSLRWMVPYKRWGRFESSTCSIMPPLPCNTLSVC